MRSSRPASDVEQSDTHFRVDAAARCDGRSDIVAGGAAPVVPHRKLEEPMGSDLTGRTLGEFVVEAPIANGGGGTVYRALQASLDRRVAIKVALWD